VNVETGQALNAEGEVGEEVETAEVGELDPFNPENRMYYKNNPMGDRVVVPYGVFSLPWEGEDKYGVFDTEYYRDEYGMDVTWAWMSGVLAELE